MILPFSTQLNGKPTYFVERIHAGIVWNQAIRKIPKGIEGENWIKYTKNNFDLTAFATKSMKIHTIREDKNDRWKSGKMIDFFIYCRQPNMFRFAPRIPCVSTQKVFMSYAFSDIIEISIGSRQLFGDELFKFIENDGFDTWKDFFDYFYPIIKATPDNWLEMKLIHWTDKRY
jgi:hypothetical protein